MLVHRMENKKGKGPLHDSTTRDLIQNYSRDESVYEFLNNYMDHEYTRRGLKIPQDDFDFVRDIQRRWKLFGSRVYFGCYTIPDLREWFPIEFTEILSAGDFHLVSRQVPPSEVIMGDKQLAFNIFKSKVVTIVPAEDLHLINEWDYLDMVNQQLKGCLV